MLRIISKLASEQASQEDFKGRTIYRWRVLTDKGPKICWAQSAEEALAKFERHGFEVQRVEPVAGMGENR